MVSSRKAKINVKDLTEEKGFEAKHPNIRRFMVNLITTSLVRQIPEGRRHTCPVDIPYMMFAHVIVLFARKVVGQKYNLTLEEYYAEEILKNVDLYFTPDVRETISPESFKQHYEVFKNPISGLMTSFESIKKIAIAKMLYHGDKSVLKKSVTVRPRYLKDIKKFFYYFRHTQLEMKPKIDCEYFEGSVDIIFDQREMLYICTHKYSILDRRMGNAFRNFKRFLLLGFAYYKQTGIILQKYTIYNPVLGEELSLDLKQDKIDMMNFEEAIKKDLK